MRPRRLGGASGRPLNFTVSSQMVRPRALVIAIFVLSGALGIFHAYLRAHHEDIRLVWGISWAPFAVLLFAWCKADAHSRSIAPPPGASVLVAMVAIVGVPYYFLRALPLRKAVISIARALGVYILMGAIAALTDFLTSRAFAS
jgi:hypothetical protein